MRSSQSRASVTAPLSALLVSLMLAALGALAPSALATPKPPHYSLSIAEGATTQPEESFAHMSASAGPGEPETVLSLIRSGLVIVRDTGKGGAWLGQTPNVGDVVTLESPANHLVGSVVYDGLPSIDPTVCAGSTGFSGMRSPGQTVEGEVFDYRQHYDKYGHPNGTERADFQSAQVTVLSGASYAGSFLKPLLVGQTVVASESLETPLAEGAVFTYQSENARPVGACPVIPISLPAPPPSPPPALQGTLLKLSPINLRRLLRSGWRTQVTINQPGTVIEDLYAQGGTLPASAASRHKRRAKPAVLLARGSIATTVAGKVTVVLHVVPGARHRLRTARRIHAVLLTTLRSASTGAKFALERHAVTLRR